MAARRYYYSEYIVEVRERLAHVKAYLLTDKQREFYHHVMTEHKINKLLSGDNNIDVCALLSILNKKISK